MSKPDLDAIYGQIAQACLSDGVAPEGSPGGPVHEWIKRNVNHRPGTAFFIVLGVCAAMADIQAQAEGFKNQFDKITAKLRAHGERS